MIITPEDSRWLNTLANSYRTEVAQTPVSLQESQAKNLYNIIEGIQTALQVDLSEAQVDALISALSERTYADHERYRQAATMDMMSAAYDEGHANTKLNWAENLTPEEREELTKKAASSQKRKEKRMIGMMRSRYRTGRGQDPNSQVPTRGY